MQFAEQSVAVTTIIGPILDSTGLEYNAAVIGDIHFAKNGAAPAAFVAAASLTSITSPTTNGYYTLVTLSTATSALGRLDIMCGKVGYQMPVKEFMVLPVTVFAALVTNAVNVTGGLTGATGTITELAGVIASATNITAATGVTLTATTGLGNQTADITGTITTATNLTNAPTVGDLTAAMKTSVNTEVVDALTVDTIADLSQGLPPATPTFREAVMYLYSALRNKGIADKTAGEKKFYNDADVLIWKKAVTKTATDYTEAEGATGP